MGTQTRLLDMNDRDAIHRERNTIFVLAALLLTAIVSISFYNLDRHPAFRPPSPDFVEKLNNLPGSILFADDPLALAALQSRQDELRVAVHPLTGWPPQGPVVAFGAIGGHFHRDGLELAAEESVWSVWVPSDYSLTPVFATATVEIEDRHGIVKHCEREPSDAWQCGQAGWSRVGPRQVTVDGEPGECIWAHPLPEKVLRVRYPDVSPTMPDGARLHLETALADAAVGTGAPVYLELSMGDQSWSHTHMDRPGWQQTGLPTMATTEDLVIEIHADDVGRRHLCFRFDLR